MLEDQFHRDTLTLLRSIDATLKELLALSKSKRSGAPAVAVDLDGQYGDPEIRAKDPREWTGETMKGRRFSECPPAYLRLLADRFDYFATQEADPKKLKYVQLDAARARGWAARLESGWTRVEPTPSSDAVTSDEIGW